MSIWIGGTLLAGCIMLLGVMVVATICNEFNPYPPKPKPKSLPPLGGPPPLAVAAEDTPTEVVALDGPTGVLWDWDYTPLDYSKDASLDLPLVERIPATGEAGRPPSGDYPLYPVAYLEGDSDETPMPSTVGSLVDGVGPDAPIVVNADGGKQSATLYRADLLPALAVLSVAKVLRQGAEKYGANNWRKIPVFDHLNHSLIHLMAYTSGDQSDDHLPHAACRLLFALELILSSEGGV